MALLFKSYRGLVDKFPYTVQILTAGIMCTTGDVLTQAIERRRNPKQKFNFKRAAVMGSFGLFVAGPMVSVALRWLHINKVSPIPSVFFDQLVIGPVLLSIFTTAQPTLMGVEWKEVKKNYFSKLFHLIKCSWTVWFPAQLVNFYLVPYQFRLLYIQCFALMWNMFLSYKANNISNSKLKQNSDKPESAVV